MIMSENKGEAHVGHIEIVQDQGNELSGIYDETGNQLTTQEAVAFIMDALAASRVNKEVLTPEKVAIKAEVKPVPVMRRRSVELPGHFWGSAPKVRHPSPQWV
jgi:hypothetical protein